MRVVFRRQKEGKKSHFSALSLKINGFLFHTNMRKLRGFGVAVVLLGTLSD